LMAIVLWHILVNGAVWVIAGGSIIKTYIAAIPFDAKLAISTGLYVALFHSTERILAAYSQSNRKLLDRFTN